MTNTLSRAALAAAIATGLSAASAQAQTAYEINRLNQAVQICNSPMGAGMAECAQLRARLGGGGGAGVPGVGGLGGFGGGKAAGIAGLLGVAVNVARSQQAAAAAAPPAANPGAVQQAIATCVQNAGGNNAAIQACLQIANAGQSQAVSAVPPPASNPFGSLLPTR